jgi:hypothetical protein
MTVFGAITVPSMCWPSTAMSTASSRVVMGAPPACI